MDESSVPAASRSARTSPKKPQKKVSLVAVSLLPPKPAKPAKEVLINNTGSTKLDNEEGLIAIPTAPAKPQRAKERHEEEEATTHSSDRELKDKEEIVALHALLRQRDKERSEQQARFEEQHEKLSSLKTEIDNLSETCRKYRLEVGSKDYKLTIFGQEKLEWQEESTKRYTELKKEIFALQETCRKHKIEIITKDSEIAAWRAERDAIETELDNHKAKVERESLYSILSQKNASLNFGKEKEAINEKMFHLNAEIKSLREENDRITEEALQWKTRALVQKRQYMVAKGYAVNFGFTNNDEEEDLEAEHDSETHNNSKVSYEESKSSSDIGVYRSSPKSPTSTRRTCQEEIQRYLQLIGRQGASLLVDGVNN